MKVLSSLFATAIQPLTRRPMAPKSIFRSTVDERRYLSEQVCSAVRAGESLRVLEAGCGQYWEIDTPGVELHITGVDTDAAAMQIRRQRFGDIDVELNEDLRTVELADSAFDVVYCAFVLEHIDGAEGVLRKFVKAVRPGGLLVLRVPDRDTVYGALVRRTPHKLHVLYKRHVERLPQAGEPGHAPYPVHYDEVVSLRGLHAFAESHEARVVGSYGSDPVTGNFGRLAPLVRRSMRGIAAVSGGWLLGTHTNIGVVLQRR